jgi:probable F420-dependent oxidoreductase
MDPSRRFRFGASSDTAGTRAEWIAKARHIEDLGYSTMLFPDHIGDQRLAPISAAMCVADATETLRIGTFVLNNDYRNPTLLAKEAATLDLLSDGRFELGLGAGWLHDDYDFSGLAFDPPGVRVGRLEEAIQVIRSAYSAKPFDFDGNHYQVKGLLGHPAPVQPGGPPLMVGGGGRRILSIAAREADIVNVQFPLTAGTTAGVAADMASADTTRQQLEWIRAAAGTRFEELELSTAVYFAAVTDDRRAAAEQIAPGWGFDVEVALNTPHILIGSVEQMVDQLVEQREKYGISYIVFAQDTYAILAPVVERLAGT